MANKKVTVDVGFSINKAGLEEMQFIFQRIAKQASSMGDKANDGLKKAGQTAQTLNEILKKTFNTELGTLNVTKFNQELQKSNLSIKQIKTDLAGAGNQGVVAFNRLAQSIATTNIQIKQSSKLLDSMFTTFKNTIRYGISSSIFNNFTNSVSKAYEYTKKLDSSLNDIRIVTGKSAEEMDKFAVKANNAAKQLGASTLDMTKSSLIYYQQGLSDAEAQARAETTVKVANVTGQSAEEVSEELTAVWNGYKVSAQEAELYIDKLAAVGATTASSLEELATGMSKVASAAQSMGVDFDDLNAQIATIVSVTRQAPESVGTALKTIYARLGDLKVDGVDEFGVKLGEVSSQLQVMGIQILDQEGNMRDMSSVMAEVAEKWNTWTDAQRQAAAVAMAGKRQYNNLIALFDNWDMYSDALKTSANAMGTLQKQQDIYMESTEAKLTKLRATWQELYKNIGNTKTIQGAIGFVTNFVDVLNNFVSSFGGGMKSVLAFGVVIANVFNKQITSSIVSAVQESKKLENNIETYKNILETKKNQFSGTDVNGNEQYANQATASIEATRNLLENTEKIHALRGVLTQEQQNELLNNEKLIAQETEKKVELEEQLKKFADRNGLAAQYHAMLEMDETALDAFDGTLQNQVLTEEQINQKIEEQFVNIKKTEDAQKLIAGKTVEEIKNLEGLSDSEKEILLKLKQQKKESKGKIDIEKALLQLKIDYIKKENNNIELTDEQKRQLEAMKKTLGDIADLEDSINNNEQQRNDTFDFAEQAATASLSITSLIGSLGTLAMAWSSVTSLIDTWNDKDASFGDKILQTFMTLGFTLPMVTSTFSKMSAALDAYNIVQKKNVALNELATKQTGTKIALDKAGNLVTKDGVKITEEEAAARGIVITEKKTEAGVTVAVISTEKAEVVSKTLLTGAVEKLTLSLGKLKAAILANPWLLLGTAVVASIAMVVAADKKYNEQQLENANKTLEDIKAKQEEVKANQELCKSYDELYKKYKAGNTTKEEVGKLADQLAEKYHLEGVELAKLTGNYDEFTKALKDAQQEELKNSVKDIISGEWASGEKMMQTAKGAGSVSKFPTSNGYHTYDTKQFGSTTVGGTDDAFIKALKKNSSHLKETDYYNNETGELVSTGYSLHANNAEDPKEMLAIYKEIEKTVNETKGTQAEQTQGYKEAVKYLETMKESMEEYEAIEDTAATNNMQMAWNSVNISQLDDYESREKQFEDYLTKIGQLRAAFRVANKGDQEKAEKELQKYLNDMGGDFAAFAYKVQQIGKTAKFDPNELLTKLDDKQLEALMSGSIDLSQLINYDTDEVIEIINTKMHEIPEQDVEIVVSLRAKITSDKKLTKKELEEALGEKSELLNDEKFGTVFNDFDNMSSLEQLELLNNVIAERINLNKEWEKSEKELYTTKVKAEQKKIEDKKREKEDLQKSLNTAGSLDQINSLRTAIAKLDKEIEESENKISDYQDAMSQFHFNEVRFDNLIAGIDGVISEAQALKDLTSAIGEGWVIAADKVENFAKNFPELLADQENYNFLQDGSLHLTEEGQAAFEKIKEARKEEIILQNESYKKELQITADKKLAEYEYYKNMADILERQVNGEEEAAQQEADLEKNLTRFKVQMMNITGKSDNELNAIIQKNSIKTTDAVVTDVEEQYKAYQQLASAIVACTEGREVPAWQPNRASSIPKEVDTAGHEIKFESNFISPSLTPEQKAKMAEFARESAEVAYNEYSTAISKIAAADAQTNALLAQLDNTGKGKDKNKNEKALEDEFDRYYDIKNAIELVNNALDKLEKIQSKLHGKELIQSLKNENDLLEEQCKNYEQLYEQQKQELAEVQNTLVGYGANFDENGFLTNYATLTASALEDYKIKIAKAATDEAKQFYEKQYEDFKKQLERYNTLYYSDMKDTQDKLDEARKKIIENNLKSWETEIQIGLDTQQAKRDWDDFLKEINEDFKKVYKDLSIEMDHLMTKMETYSGMGTIETDLQAIKDVMIEIDKLNSGQASDMFESISDAQEKLKELDKQLEDDAKNMKALWQEAWNTYLEGIDQTDNKLDDLMAHFDKMNEELEFQGRLIELLYGEKAYDLMDKLYKGQEQAMMGQIGSIKDQVDMWHQLWVESGATMDNQAEWSEDQKKYYEQWMESQSKLNDLTTEYIELLQKDYLNTVNNILKQLETAITGSSLNDIATQWDRIKADSDKYYDDIEHAYEVQKFANKIDQEIAKATGKNQQKLQALRDKEIAYLREKENLTKYDLDAAEARYQIALKEIALEEAQQNKTSMKLVRNEQGNWSYQYMADAEEVAKKQDDLLQSYGDLYKLADDAYQDNLESLQSLQETYLQSAKEINSDLTLSEEEREQKLLELRTWYEDQYNKLAKENELYRQDLSTAGAGLLLQVYQQDQDAYAYMTFTEQALLDGLISSSISSYQELENAVITNYNNIGASAETTMASIREDWTSSAQRIADAWNADDGQSVKSQIEAAHTAILEASQQYQAEVKKLAEEVEKDFGKEGIAGSIDMAAQSTEHLRDTVSDFCVASEKSLTELKEIVNKVGNAFTNLLEPIQSAINKIQEYVNIVGEAKRVAAEMYSITGGDFSGSDYDYKTKGGNGEEDKYVLFANDTHGHIVFLADNNGKGFTEQEATSYISNDSVIRDGVKTGNLGSPMLVPWYAWDGVSKVLQKWPFGSKAATLGFDTGGYTGAWSGDNGKLAMLHQKELVLNADDTANFLSGISMLRNMVSLNGSIEQSIAAAIGNMALQLGGINAGSIGGKSSAAAATAGGDTYYVTAEFPNANDAEEIRQAIMNLPNVVSQYLGRNRI